MKKGLLVSIAVGAWIISSASSASQAAGPRQAARVVASVASTPSAYRPVVDKYCISCHNELVKTGNLALDKMDLAKADNAEALEKVVRKLRSGQMPPIVPRGRTRQPMTGSPRRSKRCWTMRLRSRPIPAARFCTA
jgi:hypothetical protein